MLDFQTSWSSILSALFSIECALQQSSDAIRLVPNRQEGTTDALAHCRAANPGEAVIAPQIFDVVDSSQRIVLIEEVNHPKLVQTAGNYRRSLVAGSKLFLDKKAVKRLLTCYPNRCLQTVLASLSDRHANVHAAATIHSGIQFAQSTVCNKISEL